ncbi:hypothetical protein [Leisingera methylohalidivorans]|uniref:Uncharacterized protein n=1 Tax=Leisingera methylohalidivorans DSM 14336 TaxID=999552 RepID=V9W292_9RHOB|nr:hypothetical protein [Leisingera methylohalidivorans]AHD03302.1 hypothetical protein METH_19855 [Leisingera methylohalidivorans DSM 14336]
MLRAAGAEALLKATLTKFAEPGDQVYRSALPFCARLGVQHVLPVYDVDELPALAVSEAGFGNADRKVCFLVPVPPTRPARALMQ